MSEIESILTLPVDKPRIFGFETEYGFGSLDAVSERKRAREHTGFSYTMPEANNLSITNEEIERTLPPKLAYNPEYGGFCTIGRIYAELQGDLIEYSSPELLTIRGLIASYFANERHISHTTETLLGPKAYAIKRSLDSAYNTRGDHENYLVGIHFKHSDAERLASHLAVRSVLTGPGGILPVVENGRNALKYFFDQRTLVTDQLLDTQWGGHSSRGFMKSTITYESDPTHSQRLQVVSGSHNMFAYPIAARIFNTSSVLRLIEHGQYPASLDIEGHSSVGKNTAYGGENAIVEMADGTTSTPANIEYELMQRCLHLDLPAEEKQMAELSANIAADIAAGLSKYWSDHLEWVAKRDFLQAKADKLHITMQDMEIAATDIRWHIVGKHGLADRIRKVMPIALKPSDRDLKIAMYEPFDKTRALARSKLLRKFAQSSDSFGIMQVSWGYAATDQRVIRLPDPYQSEL